MTNLGREELNEYLEKPLVIETGGISTQVDVSATSLSTGGIVTGKQIGRAHV